MSDLFCPIEKGVTTKEVPDWPSLQTGQRNAQVKSTLKSPHSTEG